jgi:ubiquinone biosynthesis accessory factor UbiK
MPPHNLPNARQTFQPKSVSSIRPVSSAVGGSRFCPEALSAPWSFVTLTAKGWGYKHGVIDPKTIEQVIAGMQSALPGGVTQDLEKNLRAALTAAFTRLNLVTREELDVQAAVLARTRARLEELEKQVAELEKALLKK